MEKILKDVITKEDYEEYSGIVREYFKENNIKSLSLIDNDSEGYFSGRPCNVCKRPLGGTRYDVNYYDDKQKEIFNLSVCEDCYYFAEYGHLDDMTIGRIVK